VSKILIADDEREAIEVLYDFLSDLGHEVTTALDGAEAVQKIKECRFEIVILDLKMPRVSGEEVLRMVVKESPSAKIIITTGYSDDGQSQSRLTHPNVGAFIEKPIDLEYLEECIKKINTE
jgi:CheY-like chemotaxis protein